MKSGWKARKLFRGRGGPSARGLYYNEYGEGRLSSTPELACGLLVGDAAKRRACCVPASNFSLKAVSVMLYVGERGDSRTTRSRGRRGTT